MEDISREMEKEIARAKPSPHTTELRQQVLVVDDFGNIRSGKYLKTLARLLGGVSMAATLAAAGLFWRYSQSDLENRALRDEVASLTEQNSRLTKDRELLMARLVMSGTPPELGNSPAESSGTASQNQPANAADAAPAADLQGQGSKSGKAGQAQPVDSGQETDAAPDPKGGDAGPGKETAEQAASVTVEKFSVSRNNGTGDLMVRFDIRNVAPGPGEVSGRIFAVLKPKDAPESQWLVMPEAELRNGIPAAHSKGQYFSISRFKPVEFRIRKYGLPERFRQAAVYIFNDDGKLMSENLIEIADAERG